MKLKKYISPEFQWMMVDLIDDALSGSRPEDGGFGDDGDIEVDEESGEEDVNEATSPSFSWDW